MNFAIQNFPIPDFVPVPGAEIMQTIRVVSLIVGICLVGVGVIFQFLCKRNVFCNRRNGSEKKTTALWIVIGVGVLLIVNHGIQLLF